MAGQDGGSAGGLEAVFLANRGRLLGFIRQSGGGDDAEDILQDAWLRIRATGPVEAPLAYLHRVVYSTLLDRRRGQARARRRDAEWTHAEDRSEPVRTDVDAALIARQDLDAVQRRIDALGEPTATILRRHRLLNQPQKRVARDLGLSLSTVERHLRQAYAMLHSFRENDLEA